MTSESAEPGRKGEKMGLENGEILFSTAIGSLTKVTAEDSISATEEI
jgi:hypothetical protein